MSTTMRFWLVLVAVAASACASEARERDDDDSAPSELGTVFTAAEGGMLIDAGGGVSLVAPAGAVLEDTEVALHVQAATPETATNVFRFEPATVAFAVAATLTVSTVGIDVPSGTQLELASWVDGSWVQLPGAEADDGVLRGPIARLGSFSLVISDAHEAACDSECMDQPGAVCCSSSDCEAAEVACLPNCGSGLHWDSELLCCYDSEAHVCA